MDGTENTTAYSDETCEEQTVSDHKVTNFEIYTMVTSDTFNPYTYYETGEVQITTRFDG